LGYHESAEEVTVMKHDKSPFHVLAIISLIVGLGLAISGGPVAWAVLVMIGPPVLILYMLHGAGRAHHEPRKQMRG
jgi:hypothetical protein